MGLGKEALTNKRKKTFQVVKKGGSVITERRSKI